MKLSALISLSLIAISVAACSITLDVPVENQPRRPEAIQGRTPAVEVTLDLTNPEYGIQFSTVANTKFAELSDLTSTWKKTLVSSMQSSLKFTNAERDRGLLLEVKVKAFEVPRPGFTMTSSMTALYILTDQSANVVLVTHYVSSTGTSDTLFRRVENAVSAAIADNIRQFIQYMGHAAIPG